MKSRFTREKCNMLFKQTEGKNSLREGGRDEEEGRYSRVGLDRLVWMNGTLYKIVHFK